MTKKEALEFSIELWEWLVDNPRKDKHHHPTLPTGNWSGSCPTCEYTTKLDHRKDCDGCPMYRCWPSVLGPVKTCLHTIYNKQPETAFDKWSKLKNNKGFPVLCYDISFFAAVLVEAFKERLDEL